MKTIKIIDLLNKIANGEEVPYKIIYGNHIYTYNSEVQDYDINDNCEFLLERLFSYKDTSEILELELEIQDEEDEFEDIEEMNLDVDCTCEWNFGEVYDTINQLIKNQKKIIERLKDKE